jgi:hypothetical protein
MVRKKRALSLFGVAFLLWPVAAIAGSIYLNGVKIDGVTNQKFEKCSVTIDARGDVFIEAPGYAVQGAQTTPSTPARETPAIGQRYFLIKTESQPGQAQYDIDIYINSVWFKKLRSDGEQLVLDITDKLRPGPNVLHFAANKNLEGGRKSYSKQAQLQVIVGAGNQGGRKVMIDQPLINYVRTAFETENFNDEFNISVK